MAGLACVEVFAADLNPIRVALAQTIEDSNFTSAQKTAAGLHREFSFGEDVKAADEISVQKPSGSGEDTGNDGRELATVESIPSAN